MTVDEINKSRNIGGDDPYYFVSHTLTAMSRFDFHMKTVAMAVKRDYRRQYRRKSSWRKL